MIGFEVLARDGTARRGRLVTAHGAIDTPVFMPVGTAGTVKAMTSEGVAATGARIVIVDASLPHDRLEAMCWDAVSRRVSR